MSQMNVTVCGNLTAAPYFKWFPASGNSVCKMRIASSRRRRTGEQDNQGRDIWEDTDQLYIDVECWNQLAINARTSLFRGAPVMVSGRLVTETWVETNDAGEKLNRYRTVLKADKVAFELGMHQISSWKITENGHTLEGQPAVKIKTAVDFMTEEEREFYFEQMKMQATASSADSASAAEPQPQSPELEPVAVGAGSAESDDGPAPF